jgi:hypothetical protein
MGVDVHSLLASKIHFISSPKMRTTGVGFTPFVVGKIHFVSTPNKLTMGFVVH